MMTIERFAHQRPEFRINSIELKFGPFFGEQEHNIGYSASVSITLQIETSLPKFDLIIFEKNCSTYI